MQRPAERLSRRSVRHLVTMSLNSARRPLPMGVARAFLDDALALATEDEQRARALLANADAIAMGIRRDLGRGAAARARRLQRLALELQEDARADVRALTSIIRAARRHGEAHWPRAPGRALRRRMPVLPGPGAPAHRIAAAMLERAGFYGRWADPARWRAFLGAGGGEAAAPAAGRAGK